MIHLIKIRRLFPVYLAAFIVCPAALPVTADASLSEPAAEQQPVDSVPPAQNELSAPGQPSPVTQPADSISATTTPIIEREDMVMRFTTQGGCIEDVQLKAYKERLSSEENAHVTSGYFPCRVLGIRLGEQNLANAPATYDSSVTNKVRVTQEHDGIEVVKEISPTTPYTSDLKITVRNKGSSAWSGAFSIDLGAVSEHKDAGGLFTGTALEYREATALIGDELIREKLVFESSPTPEIILEQKNIQPQWVTTNSLYFATALMPKSSDLFSYTVLRTGSNVARNSRSVPDRTLYDALLTTDIRELAPGAEKTLSFDLYTGPKSKAALSGFPAKQLDKNIDYGFFAVIAWPLYYFLSWCHGLLGNWGLAIIALTIVLKIILYPLTEKAFVAGKKMQKIQPELNALKEKYKDDRQAQQREMMSIMSQKGVNPMSGCLPILPQLPIFFGLNAVLLHTFELRHAPFAGWLSDLTDKDPLYVTPAVMAVLMYAQQKLTPSPASMDPAQQKMMQWLPVIFAVFMLTYPSGLVLYIITNTVLSLIQQQWIMKKYKDA